MIVFGYLSACNISVTSFPSSPEQPAEQPTECTPTLIPIRPRLRAIDAPLVESPRSLKFNSSTNSMAGAVTETQIVRTNDGGVTWYNVTPPDVDGNGFTVETFILDRDHAWVQKPDFNNFPNNGLLYRTTDGGTDLDDLLHSL